MMNEDPAFLHSKAALDSHKPDSEGKAMSAEHAAFFAPTGLAAIIVKAAEKLLSEGMEPDEPSDEDERPVEGTKGSFRGPRLW